MNEDLKERLRLILFWVFLSVFVMSACSAMFVFVVYQTNLKTPIPLLRELIVSVICQAAIGILALWRNLFGLGSTSPPREKPIRGQTNQRGAQEIFEQILLDVVITDIRELRLSQAMRRIELVRRVNAPFVSEQVIATEFALRGLLGQGHYIISHLDEIKDSRTRHALQFEPALISYGTRDGPLKLPRRLQSLDKSVQVLWKSLAAVEAVGRIDLRSTKKYFGSLDHNSDSEGLLHLNPYDRSRCYSAIPLAIAASFVGDVRATEAYLAIAKSAKRRAIEFGFVDYPLVATVADLHYAFVRTVLGIGHGLTATTARSIPGHAHVIARHSQILAHNRVCLATIEKLGSNYSRPIRADELRERLVDFERFLRNNAVHVTGGLTAG